MTKTTEDLTYEKKMADVLLDRGEDITIAGKTYKLKALKMRTRWYISESINKIQMSEKDTMNVVEAMFTDIPEVAKIITYAILRDKDKIEDAEVFGKLYDDILECDNLQEYLDAMTTIIRLMDVEWFFFIQEIARGINILPSKAGLREESKRKTVEQGYTQHPVSLEM